MNNEFGKSLMQFKVWIPDWFRVRFGEKGLLLVCLMMDLEMKEQMRDEGL